MKRNFVDIFGKTKLWNYLKSNFIVLQRKLCEEHQYILYLLYYRRKKFLYVGFKRLLNLKYTFCDYFYEYFRLTRVRSTKKNLSTWNQMYFHFVNSLGENLLQVLGGDLLMFVFDWWDLARKQNYEIKQANFITLLKLVFGIFLWFFIWFDNLSYYFPLDLVSFHLIRLIFV